MKIYRTVRIQNLPIGTVLQAPITDPSKDHLTLLGTGHEITRPFLNWLESRGITQVEISLRDLGILSSLRRKFRGDTTSDSADVVEPPQSGEWSDRIDELLEDISSHCGAPRRSRPSCGA